MENPDLTPAQRLPRFDLRQTRAFLCLAEELHFGRAATRLFTSQPALSRTIHALEESVGLSLFERSNRRVKLTASGESFALECRLALTHFERALSAAHDAAVGRAGRLRLAYMDFAINGRLPELLRDYRTRYPNTLLDMTYMPSAQQRVALLEGRIDIGFMIGEFESSKIRNLLIDQDDVVALLPEGHALARRTGLRLADLAQQPWVLGTEESFGSFRRHLLPWCHEAGFMPDVVQQASNSNGIFGLVAAGIGVSVYAGCARNVCRTGVVVRPLADVAARIPIFAAWASHHPSEVLLRFTETLLGAAHPGAARGRAVAVDPR